MVILAATPGRPRFSELLQRPELQGLATYIGVIVIVAQIVGILSNWIASRAVAERQTATFWSAVKLWLFQWLFVVVLIIASALLIPFAASLEDSFRTTAVLGGAALLSIVCFFLIPMKIYILDLARAFGLLVLSFVMQVVTLFCVQFAVQPFFFSREELAALQTIAGSTPEEQRRFGQRVAGMDAPDEIDRLLDDTLQPIGPRKSLAEREAAVAKLQPMLSERKRTLPPGNPEAAANFQAQLDRYLRLLEEVKAERSAPPPPATH